GRAGAGAATVADAGGAGGSVFGVDGAGGAALAALGGDGSGAESTLGVSIGPPWPGAVGAGTGGAVAGPALAGPGPRAGGVSRLLGAGGVGATRDDGVAAGFESAAGRDSDGAALSASGGPGVKGAGNSPIPVRSGAGPGTLIRSGGICLTTTSIGRERTHPGKRRRTSACGI